MTAAVWLLFFCVASPGHCAEREALMYRLDMVHHNPGEKPTRSQFLDPAFLKSWGYNGQVLKSYVQCAVTMNSLDPAITSKGSKADAWIQAQAAEIDVQVVRDKAAGIAVYPFTDFLVVPRSLAKKYGAQMGTFKDGKFKPDINKPFTQKVVRAQIDEIFSRFPDLDGITLRFGETYLDDTPYHVGDNPTGNGDRAVSDQVLLIKLLREEVCVKRNKKLFYRTWTWMIPFHDNADFYKQVTDQVEPHPNLIFSIKHQRGDYHRLQPFNETLGVGKHAQIVEVQCQLEAYGKGAHPYYNGMLVDKGWEEYDSKFEGGRFASLLARPGAPKCLKDLLGKPQFKGIMTWSRGGGWAGPTITNEFWIELNTYIFSQWALHPDRSEKSIFSEFARKHGFTDKNEQILRDICVKSAHGVLLGQLTTYGDNNPWWTRDEFIGGEGPLTPQLTSLIKNHKVEEALSEKAESVRVWTEIESLSARLNIKDKILREFIQTSCTYGRIKYAIIEKGWIIALLGHGGDQSGQWDKARLAEAIRDYDALWLEWKALKESSPSCATLYKDSAFRDDEKNGIGATVNKYRPKAI